MSCCPPVFTVLNQRDGFNFLLRMFNFDLTKNLCVENNTDATDHWWLWSDNKLAGYVFWNCGRSDIFQTIEIQTAAYMKQFNFVYLTQYAGIINDRAHFSLTNRTSFNPTGQIWYDEPSGVAGSEIDYTLYADIAFEKALDAWQRGDLVNGQSYYTTATNFWDGWGMADKPFTDAGSTFYSTLKIAMWKIVAARTGFTPGFPTSPANIIGLNQIATGSVEDGGIRVAYRKGAVGAIQVDTGQHANTETTAISMIAGIEKEQQLITANQNRDPFQSSGNSCPTANVPKSESSITH